MFPENISLSLMIIAAMVNRAHEPNHPITIERKKPEIEASG